MDDVNKEETPAVETPKEEPSTPETEEKTVPYSRFKEVVDEKNQLLGSIDNRLEELGKKETSPAGLSDTEQAEQKAKEYIRNEIRDELKSERAQEATAKQAEQVQLDKDVQSQLDLNPDVKKEEFLKFMEEGDRYGVSTVGGFMELFKDLRKASTKGADEAAKDIASKPSLPSHEGGSQVGGPPEGDAEKDIFQIASDAKQSL